MQCQFTPQTRYIHASISEVRALRGSLATISQNSALISVCDGTNRGAAGVFVHVIRSIIYVRSMDTAHRAPYTVHYYGVQYHYQR